MRNAPARMSECIFCGNQCMCACVLASYTRMKMSPRICTIVECATHMYNWRTIVARERARALVARARLTLITITPHEMCVCACVSADVLMRCGADALLRGWGGRTRKSGAKTLDSVALAKCTQTVSVSPGGCRRVRQRLQDNCHSVHPQKSVNPGPRRDHCVARCSFGRLD